MVALAFGGRDLFGVQIFTLPFKLLGWEALGLLTGDVALSRLAQLVVLQPIDTESVMIAVKHPNLRVVPAKWMDKVEGLKDRHGSGLGSFVAKTIPKMAKKLRGRISERGRSALSKVRNRGGRGERDGKP